MPWGISSCSRDELLHGLAPAMPLPGRAAGLLTQPYAVGLSRCAQAHPASRHTGRLRRPGARQPPA